MNTRLRWILPAAAAIVLGAATTVGIAWASAAWRDAPLGGAERYIGKVEGPITDTDGRSYIGLMQIVFDYPRWDARTIMYNRIRTNRWPTESPEPAPTFGPEIDWFLYRRWPDPGRTPVAELHSWQVVRMYGWPMRCGWDGFAPNQELPQGPGWTESGYGGIQINRPGTMYRSLPTRPMWLGLAVDIVVFAALWMSVLWWTTTWRSRRRIRRGLCAVCAYDLRATPPASPCPECGRPTSAR